VFIAKEVIPEERIVDERLEYDIEKAGLTEIDEASSSYGPTKTLGRHNSWGNSRPWHGTATTPSSASASAPLGFQGRNGSRSFFATDKKTSCTCDGNGE
jgi:hypothetical protein